MVPSSIDSDALVGDFLAELSCEKRRLPVHCAAARQRRRGCPAKVRAVRGSKITGTRCVSTFTAPSLRIARSAALRPTDPRRLRDPRNSARWNTNSRAPCCRPAVATGMTVMEQLLLRYDPRKPRELANIRLPTFESNDPPSELVIRGSNASAAASPRRAISMRCSVARLRRLVREKLQVSADRPQLFGHQAVPRTGLPWSAPPDRWRISPSGEYHRP